MATLVASWVGFAAPVARAEWQYQPLLSFGFPKVSGGNPQGKLLEGVDGALYGTTYAGGSNFAGTVFRINKDGTGAAALLHFAYTNGSYPTAGLVAGPDGKLYGTTTSGGPGGGGTVFRLSPDGSGFSLLHAFAMGDGMNPQSSLVWGDGGMLFGTTYSGGAGNGGTLYRLSADGSGYSVLRGFSTVGADGRNPAGGLLVGSDGRLYGTTYYGGSANGGTVFTLKQDGSGYIALRSFSFAGGDGVYPRGELIEGGDGTVYGTTYSDGVGFAGIVYRMLKDGSGFLALHRFTGIGGDGRSPAVGLASVGGGVLLGTTYYGGANAGGTIFQINGDGSGYAILRSFSGAGGDGQNPGSGLALGDDGALYGMTVAGGDNGEGIVFRLVPPVAPPPRMVSATIVPGGVAVRFTSVPGSNNQLQRAEAMAGSWLTLTNIPAPASGAVDFTDATPSRNGFYRVVRVAP